MTGISTKKGVTICDPIYGSVELDPVAKAIVDHELFQRLRHVKQLGIVYMIYPSASHCRFTHSIGTYHLAKVLIESLRSNNSSCCSDDEAECVAIAGLCHDLGHGPFSHLWERYMASHNKEYHHETVSLLVFYQIVCDLLEESSRLSSPVATFLRNRYNVWLILLLIVGKTQLPNSVASKFSQDEIESFKLSDAKHFLLEIVCNQRNGFDVDKIDYINRDSHYLGLNYYFPFQRQFSLFKVLPLEKSNKHVIACRDKQIFDYVNLLCLRREKHFCAYQHRKADGFNLLLMDIFDACGENIVKEMSDDVGSRENLDKLTDLVDVSLMSRLKSLAKGTDAEILVKRFNSHSHYSHLSSFSKSFKLGVDADDDLKSCLKSIKVFIKNFNKNNQNNFVATLSIFDYGSKELKHPLDGFCYYTKNNSTVASVIDDSSSDLSAFIAANIFLSDNIVSLVIRFYSKNVYDATQNDFPSDASHELIKIGFQTVIE